MEVREFVAICLILIAMVAVTVFVINIAWNLAEMITNGVVIVITVIRNVVLIIGSIVVGIFSCIVLGVVSVIVGLIASIKKKCRKDK